MAHTHDILGQLVDGLRCKPGWSFRLQKGDDDDVYPKLVIRVPGYDASRPEDQRRFTVDHFFPVPEATFTEQSWLRWAFEMCRRLENHELGEWFRLGDERPFRPLHGPGEDPYTVHEFRPDVDSRTTQDGSVRE
jgi:hypothetical protein